MLALAHSAAMLGIDGYVVRVEADSAAGTPGFAIIGLPDRALGEARDRVRAAVVNSGYRFPAGKVLVNLAPADVRKVGPGFDLPIALALLAMEEQVDTLALQRFVALGELALDGAVRATHGVLPMAIAARNAGFDAVIVPRANAAEARLVDGVDVYAVDALHDAVAIALGHGAKYRDLTPRPVYAATPGSHGDYADVRGQSGAKRALEIAAAGGHNALLVGPPGCGKTMLAQRLPSIFPAMSAAEALDVTKIYSVAGMLGEDGAAMTSRPFRAPHHTISQIALCGGGSTPRPGEISLAHGGILFLDELPEYSRAALEVMRQPLESGSIVVARAAGTFVFPARFTLVASMNPCPCGYVTQNPVGYVNALAPCANMVAHRVIRMHEARGKAMYQVYQLRTRSAFGGAWGATIEVPPKTPRISGHEPLTIAANTFVAELGDRRSLQQLHLYASAIADFLNYADEHGFNPNNLPPQAIDQFKDSIATHGTSDRPRPRTQTGAANAARAVRRFYRWASEHGLIERCPVGPIARMPPIRWSTHRRDRVVFESPLPTIALIESVIDDLPFRDHIIALWAYTHGLSARQIAFLTVEHIANLFEGDVFHPDCMITTNSAWYNNPPLQFLPNVNVAQKSLAYIKSERRLRATQHSGNALLLTLKGDPVDDLLICQRWHRLASKRGCLDSFSVLARLHNAALNDRNTVSNISEIA